MNAVKELPIVPWAIRQTVEAMSAPELIEQRQDSKEWQEINAVERRMAELPQLACPLRHLFTPVPGHDDLHLYTREIVMPAGSIITSRIHLFEHPFIISQGVVSVWSNECGWETFRAPYRGVTKPATRRVLYIHEETTWTTFHITKQTDPDKIQDEVTHDHMKLGHLANLDPEKLAVVQANAKTKGLLT